MSELQDPALLSPYLIRRTGGGWLAIAPKEAKIAIGVAAPTEDEAKEKFRSVFRRWLEILATVEIREDSAKDKE